MLTLTFDLMCQLSCLRPTA